MSGHNPRLPQAHPQGWARVRLEDCKSRGRPVTFEVERDVSDVGVGFDDLTGEFREEYLYAVELARAQHDPTTDWEAFRDTLWIYLMRVFGLDDPAAWPAGMPDPVDGPGGEARQVAAWLGEASGEGQRSVTTDRPY